MKEYMIYTILLLAVVQLSSCNDEESYYEGYEQKFIIDGKIENNQFPKVYLTRNVPYYVNIDSSDLYNLVLKQANIKVTDETDNVSEVLTLKLNKEEFPYYYYEADVLKGKAGHSYKLQVEHGGNFLYAHTTIPNPVKLDSVWFQLNNPTDSLGKIHATLTDAPESNYYRTYTKIKHQQTQYYPTMVSNFDDKLFNGTTYTFVLNKGPETFLSIEDAGFYFKKGDTISFKISTVDKQTHEFWKSYQYEVANGANPFASSYHKIDSNIEGQGEGIWAGYGSTIYTVIAKK